MAPQHNENDLSIISTEIDQLLPVNERKIYPIKTSRHARMRPLIVASVAALTAVILLSTVYSEFKHRDVFKKNDRTYTPSKQINVLNDMTTSKVNTAAKNKFHLVHKHNQKSSSSGKHKTTVCTSQLMITRHCEKEKNVKVDGGKVKATDTTDMFGNRHCSIKGKARSEYISTLFAETVQYKDSFDESAEHATSETSIKPQFTPPLKLYALSEARYKHQTKDHKNFREVETLIPTATKFHLTVDQRYGVRDEESVDNTLTAKKTTNATESHIAEGARDICNNGMVVVNWKHSRIPNLSAALGCGKEEGCPQKYHSKDFDTVWLLTFQYSIEMGNESKKSHSRNLKNSPIAVEGDWKVSAQLVKEGFDYNN
ncbi:hypothetical protein QTG54_007024 [Skeletonema marinoi]|uniref:Uncharacterized protein n=1 Tax=Skeletonema marinoi TaxID=267567 RepID=A0AAD8YBD7_9STRA|nr:hypothetical protein QTG54_007024 [Skeletonema marinoi]